MTSTLYASCAEVLTLCQSQRDDLAALLDPDSGFAPRLRQLCRAQISEIVREDPDADLQSLRLEADTWALLQALMAARKTEPAPSTSVRTLLSANPYTPPSALAAAALARSRPLAELLVVREWLHDAAPPPPPPDAAPGFRRFTRARLAQARRMAGAGPAATGDAGLVPTMDPDAVARGDGRALAAEDANYEKALTHALFACVRAGRLDDALALCYKAHQPWRAASIRGSIFFSWRALGGERKDEDAMDESEDDGWRGNRRRRLWKSACLRAALNPALPDGERTLLAALAPTPQSAHVLALACRTWHDHVWAALGALCEARLARLLAAADGEQFWEGGELPDDARPGAAAVLSADDEEAEEGEWAEETRRMLAALGNVRVEDGPPADDAYHVSQLHIILDNIEDLLAGFATGLGPPGGYNPDAPDYPHLTRFFAHLCLFMQMIDVKVDPDVAQRILEAYLQVLEHAGQRDLIALYAGALGANAVERYARFLAGLGLTAALPERRAALARARANGLDVPAVAIATAERTLAAAFEVLPPLRGPLPAIDEGGHASPPMSVEEELLLRSIEWTTFVEATYETAAEQANVVVRYFLATGRVLLAHQLLDGLPRELGVSAADGAAGERALELAAHRQLLGVRAALARARECAALQPDGMSRDTRAAWVRDYKGLVEQARAGVLKMLTEEWLVGDVANTEGDRRRRELIRIRQVYIPDLILQLHDVLVAARLYIPDTLRQALDLANIVADSRYRLYDDFTPQPGRRIGDYLAAVRTAVLAGLQDRGGSDPFRPLKD